MVWAYFEKKKIIITKKKRILIFVMLHSLENLWPLLLCR